MKPGKAMDARKKEGEARENRHAAKGAGEKKIPTSQDFLRQPQQSNGTTKGISDSKGKKP